MRHLEFLAGALVAGCICTATFAAAAPTCSGREAECHRYCDDKMVGITQCDPACDGMVKSCLETGCWDSPVTGKKCGYTKK